MTRLNNAQDLKKTELRFFGHNSFLINNNETFLLIDPWLTSKGAFFGSWFQYPKNHHLREEVIHLSNSKPGYIYYTHEHQDHFDLETLSLLSPKTKIIIPAFRDRFLFRTIKENGFDCVEISENSVLSLSAQISLQVYISELGVNRDSAIVVKTDNFVFFNQNDCKIFDRLHEIKEKITYYSVQYSGATWHPVCYTNYSNDEKIKISYSKSSNKLTNVVKAIQALRPEFFLPAAGPAIFPYLDSSLSYGKNNIFVHQDTLNDVLSKNNIRNVLYPIPGDIIDDSIIGRMYIPPPTPSELQTYKLKTFDIWRSYNTELSVTDLEKAINNRLDQIRDLDIKCDTLIKFQWGELESEQLLIDLESKKIISQCDIASSKIYILSAEKKYFSLMSSGNRWQDIILSLRASPYRNPDNFNNFINLFLFSDLSNIRHSFISSLSIQTERILKINKSGVCYEMNRRCPHQGADLSNVEINELNEIVCPRHSWRFSLDNEGQSLNSPHSICAKKIKLTPSLFSQRRVADQ